MEQLLRVSQLAHAAGVPAKTIRYYEQVGVLPAAQRSAAGYRQYSREDVHRLLFVRRARALGLSLSQVRDLAGELEGDRCSTMRPRLRRLVTDQLLVVQQRIAEFQVLERQLTDVLRRIDKTAARPDAKGCHCLDGMRGD